MIRHLARAAFLAAGLALSGCSSWFGSSDDAPLPGARIPILLGQDAPEADERIAGELVRLPPPAPNADWPQQGGLPSHSMQHLALGETITTRWQASAGSAAGGGAWLTSGPVVGGGRVFTIDTAAQVTAFGTTDGRQLWRVRLQPDEEAQGGWGGGLALAGDTLYVATGFARVFALDATSGAVRWRSAVPGPMRAAPTVVDGRVFVITIDNRLIALGASDGQVQWTHTGIAETAGLLGGASPAASRDVVIAPYSSGELFALRAQNGRPMWSDTLTAVRRSDAVSALADIRGRPVLDNDRVYAISHSGRMVAIDLRTGSRVWDTDLGGGEQPWVAGDYVYVVTNDAVVICLTAREGLVRWVAPLRLYENVQAKTGRIRWTGPVLAGDRLILGGSTGELIALSPYTGKILGQIRLSDGVSAPLALADGTLYVLTDGARLIALR